MNMSDDEQQRFLADAIKVVREQAFYMKRAIDGDNLKISLDHATEVSCIFKYYYDYDYIMINFILLDAT